MPQSKADFDGCFYFDRLLIEQGWAIDPLADGVECGFGEERMAAKDLELSDATVLCDDAVKLDYALNEGPSG